MSGFSNYWSRRFTETVCTKVASWACLAAALIFILAVTVCGSLPPTGAPPTEYEVKAAFLFNFGRFVEWPESSFLSENASFSICVLGDDPFGTALDTLRGRSIGRRTVAVWRIKSSDAAFRCQVVFVSASEKSHMPAILRALRDSNALLVGDTQGFVTSGGAIEFTLEGNHVHFTINPDAIRRAGLRASSQLLALAKIVHDGQNGGGG